MQRLFNVSEPPFDLGNDLDKVIDIEPTAGGTRDDRHSARAQTERLHNLPGDANFFLRLRGERNAYRVANAFVQQNTETDRGFDGAGEGCSRFGHAEMERIVDFLGQQTV